MVSRYLLRYLVEMSREQLVRRMLFSHAKLSSERLRGRKLTNDEHARLTRAVDTLEKAEMYIDDTPGLEAVELRSRARGWPTSDRVNRSRLSAADELQ